MPIPCPKCSVAIADGERRCGACGASLAQTARFQGPGPEAMIERERLARAERERLADIRLRRRWLGHGIAGMVIVFVLQVLFDIGSLVSPTALLGNVIIAVLVGFPMGYVISRLNAGRFKGILIGGATTTVILSLVTLVMIGQLTTVGLIAAFISGAIPGFLIGFHCENDR